MKISVQSGAPHAKKTDVLVVGVFQPAEDAREDARKRKKALSAQIGDLDAGMSGALVKLADGEGFTGAAGQTFATHTHGALPTHRVVLVGLGDRENLGVDTFRRLGGKAVAAAAASKSKRLAVALPEIDELRAEPVCQAAAEGCLLAAYKFDRHLTKDNDAHPVENVHLLGLSLSRALAQAVVARAEAIASGVQLARDLVNECAGNLTPVQFAEEAKAVGRDTGVKVTVLTEKELAKEEMGLMLSVAQAALPYTPPRLVRLHHKPKGKARKRVALVGKGLTFDSGGLDIKPAAGMLDMKVDMSGAAAVLGAMRALGQLAPDVEVVAYLGCVENGIGGNAYHPGDILKSRKGLTVEVNNTDAEGRLVLADCIDYALTKDSPDVLIDLATLTGACMVALGPSTAGLFSSDDALAEDILAAGERAGEDFWRMPLNRDLKYQLKSSVADCKNTGERWGGAITAALFLEQFVDGRARWAHLDIAGPATQDREHDYVPRGGAGFAVRTLVGVIDPL
jgi:leucyl aminopeptidase